MSAVAAAPRALPGRADIRRSGVVRASVDVLLVAAIGAVAAWPLAPVYDSPRFLVAVLIGGGIGGVATAVRHLTGHRMRVAVPAAVALVLLFGCAAAVPSATFAGLVPTPEGLLQLIASPVTVWRQVLTVPAPVGDFEALLAAPFLIAVLASAGAGLLPGGWPSLVPPVLGCGVAVAFGTAVGAGVAWPGAVLAVLLLARAALRADGGLGARASGIAVIGAAAVVGVLVAALVTPPSATVARDLVQPAFDPRAYPSPLATFRTLVERGDEALFQVDGAPEGTRLRLAVLDRYDGVVYSVGAGTDAASGAFLRLPGRIDQSVPGETVTASVTSLGYTGPWVPVLGAPTLLTATDADGGAVPLAYDRATWAAAAPEGIAVGDRLELAGVVPTTTLGAPEAVEQSALPAIPTELADEVRGVIAEAADPGDLDAAVSALTASGVLSHGDGDIASRPGHSFERLTAMLTAEPRIGDQEQFSVAAALIARELGYAVRIVVGFDVPASGTVTGADADAWIEVASNGGWVPLSTVPLRTELDEPAQQQSVRLSPPVPVNPVTPVAESTIGSERDGTAERTGRDDPAVAAVLTLIRTIGWVLLGLFVVALPAIVLRIVAGMRRLRRRRARTARRRVLGAFDDVAELIAELGTVPAVGATRRQIAAEDGDAAVRSLARLADRAAFGPDPIDDELADTAWRTADAVREQRLSAVRVARRIRARLGVRRLGARWRASGLVRAFGSARTREQAARSRALRAGAPAVTTGPVP